jgi:hypothetical protein
VASTVDDLPSKHPLTLACCPWDHDSAACPDPCAVIDANHDVRQDIWADTNTIEFIKNHSHPSDPLESTRVRKRALLFRWFNNRLFKVVKDRLTGNPVYRLVPPPKDRDPLIMTIEAERLESWASAGTSDCRFTLALRCRSAAAGEWHSSRVLPPGPRTWPRERDLGARSHGELAPKRCSLPVWVWRESDVPATQLPSRS